MRKKSLEGWIIGAGIRIRCRQIGYWFLVNDQVRRVRRMRWLGGRGTVMLNRSCFRMSMLEFRWSRLIRYHRLAISGMPFTGLVPVATVWSVYCKGGSSACSCWPGTEVCFRTVCLSWGWSVFCLVGYVSILRQMKWSHHLIMIGIGNPHGTVACIWAIWMIWNSGNQ